MMLYVFSLTSTDKKNCLFYHARRANKPNLFRSYEVRSNTDHDSKTNTTLFNEPACLDYIKLSRSRQHYCLKVKVLAINSRLSLYDLYDMSIYWIYETFSVRNLSFEHIHAIWFCRNVVRFNAFADKNMDPSLQGIFVNSSKGIIIWFLGLQKVNG